MKIVIVDASVGVKWLGLFAQDHGVLAHGLARQERPEDARQARQIERFFQHVLDAVRRA